MRLTTVANIHFLRKIAADELMDTMFFATGQRATKVKSRSHWDLSNEYFKVKIVTNRNITVNGAKCKTIHDAKWELQDLIS